MTCDHKRLRCTDGVHYCLDCGAKVDLPKAEKPPEGAAQAATDSKATKTRRPRKTKAD